MAKYHFKLNSSDSASGLLLLQYVIYGVALKELQGSLCGLLLVLRCILALVADCGGSMFAFLRVSADSCSLSSLLGGFVRLYILR